MKFDWLVVGAGFTGAVFARCMAERDGARVLVMDRRDHVGGNAYDEIDGHGLMVHRYGPHLFHTNSEKVWGYLSRFTEWRPYMHRVLGLVDGQWVPIPFNLASIDRLFPRELSARLQDKLVRAYGFGARVPILTLREHPDEDLRFLADFAYRKVFENYTRKQWNLAPEELDPSVTARVPILVSNDDRYFQDTYQAMPARGYSALFRELLAHPRIQVILNAPHQDVAAAVPHERVLFTGRIDEFFGFRLGALPYRSIRFDFRTLWQDRFQTVGTHNYPGDAPYTRITEQKLVTGQELPGRTTVVYEYPQQHAEGETEPYYPVPQPANGELFGRYQELAAREAPQVVFAGRLGDYRYYNMDQAAARALTLAEQVSARNGVAR
jgi:UDP-galactopyranose mutase